MSIKVEIWRNFENRLHDPNNEAEINEEISAYLAELKKLGWEVKDYDFYDKDDWK